MSRFSCPETKNQTRDLGIVAENLRVFTKEEEVIGKNGNGPESYGPMLKSPVLSAWHSFCLFLYLEILGFLHM